MPSLFIGTSGWNYDHWKGTFYPEACPKRSWLEYYTGVFNSVEVNATFYRHMKPGTFATWRQRSPEGFVWAVKASRFITHVKRLQHAGESLEMFFASAKTLGERLGVILFQLPPSLTFDPEVFKGFCALLPKEYRYALEARHISWTGREAMALMEKNRIAWCISDTAGRYPFAESLTADFTYIRLHGSTALYSSEYTEAELESWTKRIRRFNRDTYLYFDNDFMGYAPKNALRLRELLGI
ncbi:MAG TPA: DUF72 domain-containing protein [Deltaproteobacteria bacterium]|nr:DUF72 domain-containing protein [Deltaproteobacteria bacterium]